MTIHPSTAVRLRKPEGRVLRTPHGRWALMNKRHFGWLIDSWFQTGYDAGLRAAQEAILGKASR